MHCRKHCIVLEIMQCNYNAPTSSWSVQINLFVVFYVDHCSVAGSPALTLMSLSHIVPWETTLNINQIQNNSELPTGVTSDWLRIVTKYWEPNCIFCSDSYQQGISMSNKPGLAKDNQPCLHNVTVNRQFNVHWISQTNIHKKVGIAINRPFFRLYRIFA